MSGDVASLGGNGAGEEPGPTPGKGPALHTRGDGFESVTDLAHLGADATVLFQTASPAPAPSQPSSAPDQTGSGGNGAGGASGNSTANPDGNGSGKAGNGKPGNDKSAMDKMKEVIGSWVDKDGVRITDNISVGGSINPRMVTVTFKF